METISFVKHFNRIAHKYRALRTTYCEPIKYIYRLIGRLGPLQGLELGCGTGRYSELLLDYLPRLRLTCCDSSSGMLHELKRRLHQRQKRFKILQKKVEKLSFPQNAFDVLFSFNAIHHFNLEQAVPIFEETIRPGGRLFLYTRLPSQNKKSVWGQNFPKFAEKETRLYTKQKLRKYFRQSSQLRPPRFVEFKKAQEASLRDLLERADQAYYSTFCFYRPQEYKNARAQFIKKLREKYNDLEHISWTDRNIMVIAQKN